MNKKNFVKKNLIFSALKKGDSNIELIETAYSMAISMNEFSYLKKTIKKFIGKHPYEYRGFKLLILVAEKLDELVLTADFIESVLKHKGMENTAALACLAYMESILKKNKGTFFNVDRDCKEFDLSSKISDDFLQNVIDALYLDFDGEKDPSSQSVKGGEVRYLKTGVSKHIDQIVCLVDQYVAKYIGLIHQSPLQVPEVDDLKSSFWSVSLEQDGKMLPHFHPRGIISGVFYLRLEEGCGASLELGCSPSGVLQTGPKKIFETQPLKLIIFPSYYFHSTTSYKSDETRICVSFDYMTKSQFTRHYSK